MATTADAHNGSKGGGGAGTASSGGLSPSSPISSTNHWKVPALDGLGWIIQIQHLLEDKHEDEDENVPVSVFNVPKALLQTKPDAYVPQLIAIGPYHNMRPELVDMERYKLSAAKRTQQTLRSRKLPDVVDTFRKHELCIRAHYHRFLEFKSEVLMWMLAVDACFLLEFLQVYRLDENGKVLKRITSRMSHLVDMAGRRSAHNIILRDVMMMENQIPLFLLYEILKAQIRKQDPDAILVSMVTGFMQELSPFKMVENFPTIDVHSHAHLLEVLYYVLVPNCRYLPAETRTEIETLEGKDIVHHEGGDGADGESKQYGGADGESKQYGGDSSHVKQLCNSVWEMANKVKGGPLRLVKRVFTSRPVAFVVQVPWKLLTLIPCFAIIKGPIEELVKTLMPTEDGEAEDTTNLNKPPKVEEIMIPSVQELISAGVRFSPTNGDLTTISFDVKTITFSLPAITLDVNSNVVIRNLVAYEASVATGPLVVARYTELMNGIIDTQEDVKLLRESGIVFNHMKSDEDVANMWNGMSKSLRLTKVPFMDKAIEDINRYHSSRWRVKTGKFMKKYIFGSWPFLTFLAAILLLVLTMLEAFCSVYSCSRWFNNPIILQQQPNGG